MRAFNRRARFESAGDVVFTQVVTFEAAGKLAEIRALFYCASVANIPIVNVRAVGSDGRPLDELLAPTSVMMLNTQPESDDQLNAIVLPRPLSVRAGERVAVELSSFFTGCRIATNRDVTYGGGSLFLDGEMQPGAIVFQALVER